MTTFIFEVFSAVSPWCVRPCHFRSQFSLHVVSCTSSSRSVPSTCTSSSSPCTSLRLLLMLVTSATGHVDLRYGGLCGLDKSPYCSSVWTKRDHSSIFGSLQGSALVFTRACSKSPCLNSIVYLSSTTGQFPGVPCSRVVVYGYPFFLSTMTTLISEVSSAVFQWCVRPCHFRSQFSLHVVSCTSSSRSTPSTCAAALHRALCFKFCWC